MTATTEMKMNRNETRIAKQVEDAAGRIRKYSYTLVNPHRSEKLNVLKDQFEDLKANCIKEGIWFQVCDITGLSPRANAGDCAA
jgi:hypothetical protein